MIEGWGGGKNCVGVRAKKGGALCGTRNCSGAHTIGARCCSCWSGWVDGGVWGGGVEAAKLGVGRGRPCLVSLLRASACLVVGKAVECRGGGPRV